jgi:tetratricopeptide (TPR) repeat protein
VKSDSGPACAAYARLAAFPIFSMRLLQRHTCVWIVPAVLLLSGTPSTTPADPLPAAIRTLEADEKFAEARTQIGQLTAPFAKADGDDHIKLIDAMTELFAIVDVYVKSGLTKQAAEALNGFLGKVSAPRDIYLAVAVQRRLTEIQKNPAEDARLAAADQAAREALTRADTFFARGLYTKAKDAYSAVATQSEAIADETKARATRGVAKASQKEFEDQPFGTLATVYRAFGDGAGTLSQWLVTVIALLPVVALLWAGRRAYLTNTRTLELVDLTVVPQAPAANRELAQELEDVIDRIRRAGPGSAKLDATGTGDSASEDSGELPPPDLVFITPPVDAPELAGELEKFVSSTPSIQVGPIGFNPPQLWAFIKRLVTPRARHAFSGTLTTYDNTLILRLSREDRRLGTTTEWRATAASTSVEARITCLVDVACRIILDGQNTSTATSDCHSLKAYILGLYALTLTTADAWKSATAHFQDALDRDQGNWLARFQLALCARGRKDTRTAIHHLTWFEGAEAAASESLRRHLDKHPDFRYVVRYQLASTLALQSEEREDARVGEILTELIALEHDAAGQSLDPEKRLRLVMLARSGESTREAVRASLVRDDSPGKERTRRARERLRAHLEWFNGHADALQRASPTGHGLARGIVLHAYGRIRFASGDRNGAIANLTEAVELLPDYADVHVDLAKAQVERKGSANWPQRVMSLLDRALALDPANAKAKFVYARFYFAEETRDYVKAEPYLLAAPFDPTSLFMLAQILNGREKWAESLPVLERAIALQPHGPSFRVRLYAESLQELTKIAIDPKPSRRLMERARRQLCEYDKVFDADERTKVNYQRAADAYADICRNLSVDPGQCFPRVPPPAAAAPAPAPAVPATSAQAPNPAPEPGQGPTNP